MPYSYTNSSLIYVMRDSETKGSWRIQFPDGTWVARVTLMQNPIYEAGTWRVLYYEWVNWNGARYRLRED